ncbi:hypothetical protein T439DRAFT_378286 [Meredithblackwellia eburnea MCA 4105]
MELVLHEGLHLSQSWESERTRDRDLTLRKRHLAGPGWSKISPGSHSTLIEHLHKLCSSIDFFQTSLALHAVALVQPPLLNQRRPLVSKSLDLVFFLLGDSELVVDGDLFKVVYEMRLAIVSWRKNEKERLWELTISHLFQLPHSTDLLGENCPTGSHISVEPRLHRNWVPLSASI